MVDRAVRSVAYRGIVADDTWAGLADQFADGAYASVKGKVRTYVLHHHLVEHLPPPPATILEVGGAPVTSRSRWPAWVTG